MLTLLLLLQPPPRGAASNTEKTSIHHLSEPGLPSQQMLHDATKY